MDASLSVAGSWPLVGRADEISYARDVITEGGSVVVAGDYGVGKTRLAREVVSSTADERRRAEWAVATHASQSIPLGALAHLVPPDAVGRGREAVLLAVVEAHECRRDERLVLGVDDAHLLDAASAVLIHQLVAKGIASAVVTVRSGEAVPDPVRALWKDGLAVRVELQPLARAEVTELLSRALGGRIDGSALHALWQWTAGNLMFL